jgi:hypothetical protein
MAADHSAQLQTLRRERDNFAERERAQRTLKETHARDLRAAQSSAHIASEALKAAAQECAKTHREIVEYQQDAAADRARAIEARAEADRLRLTLNAAEDPPLDQDHLSPGSGGSFSRDSSPLEGSVNDQDGWSPSPPPA